MGRPEHLGARYGAQFQDGAVAAAYRHRPPYPEETFDLLAGLVPAACRRVLDVGCGTGDLTVGLAPRVDEVEAVDPSQAMLAEARRRPLPAGRVRWVQGSAETVPLHPPYGLVTAGESLHWMDWGVTLPRLRAALHPDGRIAIAGRLDESAPWWEELLGLIQRYSTNRDYRPYDLEALLAEGGHFRVDERLETAPSAMRQSVEAYVESVHSRNGFSRDRMDEAQAMAFDAAARALLAPFADAEGMLALSVRATILAGR